VNVVSRVIAARDALSVGDPELAEAILDDLERDLEQDNPRHSCACGLTFPWPGLLAQHQDAGLCTAVEAA
jgi:hypothetical protein